MNLPSELTKSDLKIFKMENQLGIASLGDI